MSGSHIFLNICVCKQSGSWGSNTQNFWSSYFECFSEGAHRNVFVEENYLTVPENIIGGSFGVLQNLELLGKSGRLFEKFVLGTRMFQNILKSGSARSHEIVSTNRPFRIAQTSERVNCKIIDFLNFRLSVIQIA